jgi:hypothetical protein
MARGTCGLGPGKAEIPRGNFVLAKQFHIRYAWETDRTSGATGNYGRLVRRMLEWIRYSGRGLRRVKNVAPTPHIMCVGRGDDRSAKGRVEHPTF